MKSFSHEANFIQLKTVGTLVSESLWESNKNVEQNSGFACALYLFSLNVLAFLYELRTHEMSLSFLEFWRN